MTSMGDNRLPQSRLRNRYMSAIDEANIMNKEVKLKELEYGFRGKEGIEYREIQERERNELEKARLENELLEIEENLADKEIILNEYKELITGIKKNIKDLEAYIDNAIQTDLPSVEAFYRQKNRGIILDKKRENEYTKRIDKENDERSTNITNWGNEIIALLKDNKYFDKKINQSNNIISSLKQKKREVERKLSIYDIRGGIKIKIVKRPIKPTKPTVRKMAKPTKRPTKLAKPTKPTVRKAAKPTKPTRPVVRRRKPNGVRK